MSSDEATLLASLGGVVEDMSKYEDEVIQKAQLETAPKLDGQGFPPIAPLGASYSALSGSSNRGHIPHFLAVLKKVKDELASSLEKESHRSKVLRIKEQLILASLEQYLKQDEMPMTLYEEINAEQNRLATMLRHQESTRSKTSASEIQQNAKKDKPNSSCRADKMTNDQRLELSKLNNSSQKGSGVKVSPSSLGSGKRARRSIMNWKQQKKEDNPSANCDRRLEERRKILKEMRIERQKLRKERLAVLEGNMCDDCISDEEAEFNDENEGKLMTSSTSENVSSGSTQEKDDENKKCDLALNTKDSTNDDNNGSSCPINAETAENTVECPVCGKKVSFSEEDDQDVVLAEHISNCQSNARPRTRRRSYKEVNQSTSETQEIDFEKHPRKRRLTIQQKHTNYTAPSRLTQPSSSPALDDMDEECYEDRVDDWIENGLSKMKIMTERDKDEKSPGADELHGGLIIPAWINDRLFPYQRQGLRWMWELHQQKAGGIIGDEMGLGKTVQVCAYLSCMAANRKLKCSLIICPATVLQHWLKELSIWAPGLRRILCHHSGETDGLARNVTPKMLEHMSAWLRQSRSMYLNEAIDEKDLEEFNPDIFVGTGYVFVTTYENIRRCPDVWISHKWNYVILDEGQKIRNPDADVTLACKKLRTPHRLLLSGTPIQNDLKELWTLFDFVFPGRLGTLPAFESEFSDPIKKGGYSNASPMAVQLAYRCALVLKDLINPYMLRRQKKDIKEVSRMPGKTEQVLFCRLSKRQRDLYEAYLQSDEVSNILRGSPQLLRSITILRKICNHPDLVCDPTEEAYQSFVHNGFNQISDKRDSDDEDSAIEDLDDPDSITDRSGKMQVLAKILPLWQKQGHRVLIFCQWTKMLDMLQRLMMNNGWKFGRMDGKTSVSSRQQLIDRFNSDESYFAMLMTTRTGGVGVNLTGADRVVIYDPVSWSKVVLCFS